MTFYPSLTTTKPSFKSHSIFVFHRSSCLPSSSPSSRPSWWRGCGPTRSWWTCCRMPSWSRGRGATGGTTGDRHKKNGFHFTAAFIRDVVEFCDVGGKLRKCLDTCMNNSVYLATRAKDSTTWKYKQQRCVASFACCSCFLHLSEGVIWSSSNSLGGFPACAEHFLANFSLLWLFQSRNEKTHCFRLSFWVPAAYFNQASLWKRDWSQWEIHLRSGNHFRQRPHKAGWHDGRCFD